MWAICLPRRNRSSFWAFCSKEDAICASSISKFWNSVPFIDRHDIKSSTESTISTSLIHNIVSDGWVLILIFQHENVESVGNLSKWSSDVRIFCWSTIAGEKEFTVDGLFAKFGIGIVFPLRSSPLATKVPVFLCTGIPCGTLIRSVQNSLIRYLWWLEYCTRIAKNVSLCPRQIPRIKWHVSVAPQHRSRTWNSCRLTGNVSHCKSIQYIEIVLNHS